MQRENDDLDFARGCVNGAAIGGAIWVVMVTAAIVWRRVRGGQA